MGHRRGAQGVRGARPGVRAVQGARDQQAHPGRQQGDEHARRHHQPAPGPLRADHDRGVDRAARSGPGPPRVAVGRPGAPRWGATGDDRGGVVGRSPGAPRWPGPRRWVSPRMPPSARHRWRRRTGGRTVARTRLESAVRAGNHRRSGYRPPAPVQDRRRTVGLRTAGRSEGERGGGRTGPPAHRARPGRRRGIVSAAEGPVGRRIRSCDQMGCGAPRRGIVVARTPGNWPTSLVGARRFGTSGV